MAGSIKGITIEIGGNTTKLSEALTEVDKNCRGLKSELKDVDRLLKLDPTNTELLAQKQKILKEAISNTKDKLDTLKEAEKQVQEQFENGDISEEQYRALGREIAGTEIKLKDYEGQLEEVEKANDDAADAAGELGDETKEAGDKAEDAANNGWTVARDIIADIASNVIQNAIQGVKDFAKSVVDTGGDFDTAMSQLAATMGVTTDQITDLKDYAAEMGETTKYTSTEAAEGLNILAMSGLSAEEQMAALPDVLNLASAGAMSLDDAAGYVTGTIKGFGDSCDNAQYYADLMAKGATLANTDVKGLGEALSGTAANASAYGQQADSVTLSLLKLAEGNITGSEASTALNRAMMDLYTPTDAAKGALDELGVSCYDSEGNARDLNDVMDDLSTALSGMSEEEQNTYKNTIFTTQGLSAYNQMASVSDEKTQIFKDGLAGASEEMDGAGSAAQQAGTQLDNLQGDMTLLDSATDGVKQRIYEMVQGPLRTVVQFITDSVIPVINTILDNMPTVATVIAGVALAMLAFKVHAMSAKLATEGLTIATYAQQVAQGLLNTVMNASPLGLIILAITGVIAILVTLWNNCEGFRNFWIGLWDAIKEAFGQAVEALKTKLEEIKQRFKIAWNVVENIWHGAGEWFRGIWDTISGVFAGVVDFFGSKFRAAWDAVKNAFSGFTSFFSGLWDSISRTFSKLGTSIANAISGAVKSGINGVISMIQNTVNGAIRIINGAIGLINKIPGVSVGTVGYLSLPRLAHGGQLEEGDAIVAEAGPELIQMVNGKTIVTPLTPTARNHALDTANGNGKGNSVTSIELKIENFYNNRKQDIRELTEEVLEEAERIKERNEEAYA